MFRVAITSCAVGVRMRGARRHRLCYSSLQILDTSCAARAGCVRAQQEEMNPWLER
jgi:hypothetical protein